MTTQTKHTPGKAHVGPFLVRTVEDFGCAITHYIETPTGDYVAEIRVGLNADEIKRGVLSANPSHSSEDARLIAAAPELLEAVREAHNSLMRLAALAGDVPEWNEGGHAHESAKQARAAIAKAEGRAT